MRGCGMFLLAVAAVLAVLTFGLGWMAYLPFAAVGALLLIAGNQRPRRVYRPARRRRVR